MAQKLKNVKLMNFRSPRLSHSSAAHAESKKADRLQVFIYSEGVKSCLYRCLPGKVRLPCTASPSVLLAHGGTHRSAVSHSFH